MLSPATAWPAPAKINLFLRITGRRADGYHTLQTVFQFLDLGDQLSFESLPAARIEMAEALPGVSPDTHLCVRAATALARSAAEGSRRELGARIRLKKRIPMGAGLGGGSSDAATTLVALNALWGLGITPAELETIGLTLGADVPVFVRGEAAWAEGVGEKLRPVALPQPWYVIVHPGCEVSTAEIFRARELTRNSPPIKIPRSLLGVGDIPEIGAVLGLAGNDCEAVVRRQYPQVDAALGWLTSIGPADLPARMTGTGAAVFAPFAGSAPAHAALEQLPRGWWAAVARGVNRSPLRARAEEGTVAAVQRSR